MILALGLLLACVVAALVIYLVREATMLKTTASSLQEELRHFKEGGFRQLVQGELTAMTDRAKEELSSREKLIHEGRVQLMEQQQRATKAAEEFQRSVGSVETRIHSLAGLQDKVDELNNLLKPQQLRGELGEVIIRALIADKLPPSHYEEDYTFADGKKVEFVIRLNEKLIPVDSKLQLEDFKRMREAPEERRSTYRSEFKRTVKQKIDEVHSYIRPKEGTYNFALMAIPSEAVFYELIANQDFVEDGGLYDYARSQHVFLVSPLTFWAYLTALAQGLQGLQIGRRAEEILAGLQTLASKIRDFSNAEFRVLGDQLRNATKNYDEARDKVRVIEGDLASLERLEIHHPSEQEVPA